MQASAYGLGDPLGVSSYQASGRKAALYARLWRDGPKPDRRWICTGFGFRRPRIRAARRRDEERSWRPPCPGCRGSLSFRIRTRKWAARTDETLPSGRTGHPELRGAGACRNRMRDGPATVSRPVRSISSALFRNGPQYGSPGSGGRTGVSLPQPCFCAAFISLTNWSGSVAFNLGRSGRLPSSQLMAATVWEICCISW